VRRVAVGTAVATLAVLAACSSTPPGDGPSGSSSTTATAGAGSSPSVGGRDPYAWPFSWDSIWNLPLSTAAGYHPVDLKVDATQNHGRGVSFDPEDISVDPAMPVTTVLAHGKPLQVRLDPALAGHPDIKGNWNNCAVFLNPETTGIHQGQPLNYPATGTPSFETRWALVDLTSTGLPGCHGGSSLSGLGGTLRKGEMASSGPLRHALKIELDCIVYCSRKGPRGRAYTWPATNEDGGYDDPTQGNYYDRLGTADPAVLMGSLLALPPGFDPASLTSPNARKIAQALRDYGGYVVDNTAWSFHNPKATRGVNAFAYQRGAETELPDRGCPTVDSDAPDTGCAFYRDLRTVFDALTVVTNSTATTPGGGPIGSPRRAPYAPAFADGSGAPPAQP
jgi:hypothetical protein